MLILLLVIIAVGIGLYLWRGEFNIKEKWQNVRNLFSVSTAREAWHFAFFLVGFAVLSIVFVLPEIAGWMVRAQHSDDPTALLRPLLMWSSCLIIFLLFIGITLCAIFLAYIYVSRARSGHYDDEGKEQEDEEED